MSVPAFNVLPVDDPRRPLIRRAVFGTLCTSAVFFVFTASREIKPIFNHAPWLNDPYDTVTSFTMFFVPLIAACLLVQVSLCIRSEPLPIARVAVILRACRIAIGSVIVELATAWMAVALGADRSQWTVGATGVEIGLLVSATLVASAATVALIRVPRLPSSARLTNVEAPDWLGDAVTVAKRDSRWFGPLRGLVIRIAEWSERSLLREIRRHPVVAAALASTLFGVTVLGWQGYREGYFLSATLIAMGIGFCGMFAFLVSAGSYLGLVRSTKPSYGMRRRMVDASVIACATALVPLAFHNSLWWIVASNANAAGPGQFAELIGSAVILTFFVVATVETVLRFHSRPASIS